MTRLLLAIWVSVVMISLIVALFITVFSLVRDIR